MKKLFLLTLLLTCYLINPEVIILQNGKIINGKIIKMDEDTMTVITKNKEIIIDRDVITHIFTSINDYNNYKKALESKKEPVKKGNLVGEWLFNGNGKDTSGNNANGYVTGSKKMGEDRFGNKNGAYEFGRGKTMIIAKPKKINPAQNSFSLSVWIKINKFRGSGKIIDFYSWDIRKGYYIMCFSKDGNNYKTWLSDGISNKDFAEFNLKKDIWYHLVYIYKNEKAKFYLNGIFVNEEKINYINVFEPDYYKNTWFYFGYSGAKNPFYPFSGYIDDIRYYDYALSEEEIDKLYHENGWPK